MKKISNITKHPLFSGSVIMMGGATAANAINYFYHLIVGRLLGPSSYGELAALISLSGFLGIIPASVNLVVMKYISTSKTESDKTALISWFRIKSFQVSFIVFFLLLALAPIIKSFLHITNLNYAFALAIIFLFSLPMFLNRSILQGLLKFKETTLSIIAENSIRFVVSILLIFLGYRVGGAMTGFVASAAGGWCLTNIFLKSYIGKNPKISPQIKQMLLYAVPVIVQSIALTSLYSSDLILVKHFFPAHDAGIYAALSTLGKIIFFGAGPIGVVMFPIVAQRYSEGSEYRKIFLLSLLATLILTISVLTIYAFFPHFAINLLYGAAYLEAASLLIWFGIFITLFTLSSLVISFQLSLGRTSIVWLPVVAAIAQAWGVWFFHESLFTVIVISILVTALLLSFLLIYSLHKIGGWHETKNSTSDKSGIRHSTCI